MKIQPTAILEFRPYILRLYHHRRKFEAVVTWKASNGVIMGAVRVQYPNGERVRMPSRKSLIEYVRYAFTGKGTPWTFNAGPEKKSA